MNNQSRFDIRTPSRFGMIQVIFANLLSIVPSFIAGALFGFGAAGIYFAVKLAGDVDGLYWIVLVPLGCLGLSLVMFFFSPGLMLVNYYIKALVFHLKKNDDETNYICQMATLPRTYSGVRGFLEDADDIGVLSIHANSVEFRGDHSDFVIPFSDKISVEILNVGWRGFWFMSRKVRILLPEHEKMQAIDIVERQSWTVVKSRRRVLEIFEAIERNIGKT